MSDDVKNDSIGHITGLSDFDIKEIEEDTIGMLNIKVRLVQTSNTETLNHINNVGRTSLDMLALMLKDHFIDAEFCLVMPEEINNIKLVVKNENVASVVVVDASKKWTPEVVK